MTEVIVIGGGIAGLTAAWALRDHDVVVLEAGTRLGGRVRADECDGVPYHLGAQYLAGVASAQVFDELGLDRVTLPKEGGVFLRGRVRDGSTLGLLRALRTGPRGFADLAAVQRDAVRASQFAGTLVDPARTIGFASGRAAEFDARSFADTLADRRPAVRSLYGTLICSLTCKAPANLSALYAYAMLGSEGRDGVGGANRAAGGMRAVLDAFARALDGRIRTGTTVTAVEPSSDGVVVTAGPERIVAQACVIAVPAPTVLAIAPGLSDQRRAALTRVRYGRFLSVALFLREPVWDAPGWGLACDLPVVSTLLNPAVLTGSGSGRVLSSYASDDGCRVVWDFPDEQVIARFVAEIAQVFPRVRDVVDGADVRRWDPGYPAWEPGHLGLLPRLTAPAGRLVFCGDYLSIPSIDGAVVSGLRAASDVRAMGRHTAVNGV